MTSSAKKQRPACTSAALEHFGVCLGAYVHARAAAMDLRSAALAVWNCVDPLPQSCAELVMAVTGEATPPLRYSQAARQILRALS
jgi:hypothetical protein